ncbi:MAG TPA: rhomboid family intramembrane serine protease, partial [Candidatus Limnocylindria bacterium]|nr:rhomboid family intramembrane serine protease [Candidatus Limnocylindria bacterium]
MFPIGDQNEPGRGLPFVTLAIIGLNVAIFLLLQQAGGNNDFTYGWSAIPREIVHGVDLVRAQVVVIGGQQFQVPQAPGPDPIQLTLLSSMFMHAGWLHLGGNMLFLWVFGDNVEDALGHVRYLVFYLACAAGGAFFHGLVGPDSQAPLIGASGAIAGVVTAYLILHPRVKIWILAFARIPLRIPAFIVLALWILLQFVMFAAGGEDQISWACHV